MAALDFITGAGETRKAVKTATELAQRGAKYGQNMVDATNRQPNHGYTAANVIGGQRKKTEALQNRISDSTAHQGVAQQGSAAQMEYTAGPTAAQAAYARERGVAQTGPVQFGADARMNAAQIRGGGVTNQESTVLNALTNRAMGQGPSVADMQSQRMMEANMQQQMAMAASSRGGNPGLAGRRAAMNTAQTNQNIAGQAMLARVQEQQAAQNQAVQALQAQRGQNIQLGSAQAGLEQEASRANLQSALTQAGMQQAQDQFNVGAQNTYNQFAMGQEQDVNLRNADFLQHANLTGYQGDIQQRQTQAGFDQEMGLANLGNRQQTEMSNMDARNTHMYNQWQGGMNAGNQIAGFMGQENDFRRQRYLDQMNAYNAAGNLSLGAAGGVNQAGQLSMAPGQANMQLLGNIIQGGATVAAAGMGPKTSDKRAKKNFTSPDKMNKQLLGALKASKEYSYKDGYGEDVNKRHVGPMAQQLPESMVINDNGIKKVDTGRFALSLGSLVGSQQKEIDKLKKALTSKK